MQAGKTLYKIIIIGCIFSSELYFRYYEQLKQEINRVNEKKNREISSIKKKQWVGCVIKIKKSVTEKNTIVTVRLPSWHVQLNNNNY